MYIIAFISVKSVSQSGMAQKMAVNDSFRVKSIVAITPMPACGASGTKETREFLVSHRDDKILL